MWKKIAIMARFTYINKRQSDFAISREFYFHETSHMRNFLKIKSSRKFPNLQYYWVCSNFHFILFRFSICISFEKMQIDDCFIRPCLSKFGSTLYMFMNKNYEWYILSPMVRSKSKLWHAVIYWIWLVIIHCKQGTSSKKMPYSSVYSQFGGSWDATYLRGESLYIFWSYMYSMWHLMAI